MKYAYELKMKVRDYECDLEGIVNNANYQHYMEHTRHEFLLEAGISFSDRHRSVVPALCPPIWQFRSIIVPALRRLVPFRTEFFP